MIENWSRSGKQGKIGTLSKALSEAPFDQCEPKSSLEGNKRGGAGPPLDAVVREGALGDLENANANVPCPTMGQGGRKSPQRGWRGSAKSWRQGIWCMQQEISEQGGEVYTVSLERPTVKLHRDVEVKAQGLDSIPSAKGIHWKVPGQKVTWSYFCFKNHHCDYGVVIAHIWAE